MSNPPTSPHTPAYGAVDLTTCEREPIHIPGAIQPHGVLLAVDTEMRVAMASANVKDLLGLAAEEAVGRPLRDVVGPTLTQAIVARLAANVSSEPLVQVLDELPDGCDLAGREVDVRHHRSGERLIVEVEPVSVTGAPRLSYESTRGAMARLAQSRSVADLAGQLAVEIRTLLGFDRVMVYRFDDEWNGEVIAEEKRDDLNPFLGLHYPASDIPAQARRLYTLNWTRLIADIDYNPVPLHPVFDPLTDEALDLSHASLRSVSPIHIEYLSNMGVSASMSISLVVDGELWGLVACHHYSGPHRPSHDARAAAEFLGQVASQLAADRERADARERTLVAQSVLARITARIAASADSPLDSVMDDPELLTLVNASGAALYYDGVLRTRGTVVELRLLQAMATALEDRDHYATATDRIATMVPELEGNPDVAGVLRVGSAHDRWMIFLRPEQERIVDWGGDPTNKELYAAEGPDVRLSPRKSFDMWRQVVRGRSLPWAPWKVEIADALGKYLIGLLLTRSREQIALAESVQRSVVLDHAPQIDGMEIVARYRPASTYQLGGDWWDAFELDDGSLVFVVGDVAGHGVSAASAMTQVRTALRAYLFEGHSPASCLDRLDLLMASLIDQRVATAVVGVVDPTRTRVELASAGHPPPFVVVGDGATQVDLAVRPLLGVGAGEAVGSVVDLPPGATLLLYTDGLVERRGVDLLARIERLRDVAASTYRGATDLEGWLDHLIARQDEAVPGGAAGADDDTTVLAIRLRS